MHSASERIHQHPINPQSYHAVSSFNTALHWADIWHRYKTDKAFL